MGRGAHPAVRAARGREGAETEAVPGPSAPLWLFQGRRVNSSGDRRCCACRLTGVGTYSKGGDSLLPPLTRGGKRTGCSVCARNVLKMYPMPVKRVGNCLLFRWEAQAAKPRMWLCDLKHSAGERRKKIITRWFQLTLENLNEQTAVHFSFASQLCVTAPPFRANRLTPVYLANPFYFWGVTCSCIQQTEYLESFVPDAIKDTRTNEMKFLLVT